VAVVDRVTWLAKRRWRTSGTSIGQLKSGSWSTGDAEKRSHRFLRRESGKKKRPSILALLRGTVWCRDLTRGTAAGLFEYDGEPRRQLFLRQESSDIPERRMFDSRVNERLIADNPAKKLEIPARCLKKTLRALLLNSRRFARLLRPGTRTRTPGPAHLHQLRLEAG